MKSKVDDLVSSRATLAENQKWGFSVTVSQNGNFLYRRGFGLADDSLGLEYSSQTINRLASISKAVGATMTLDLQEQGLLDIDNQTRSYVPNMPVHQSHTLGQLMSHRGGAGHYQSNNKINDDWTNPTGAFATQQAAAAQLWDQALVFAPGTDYVYSTHGYTLLGAALEGAIGGNITQIVRERLTSAYNLPTLQVENRHNENRTGVNRYRSSLYQPVNGSVQPISADNTSWKVLGGGLESSSLDLARFGQLVINGTILSPESRATAWTAPDANKLNYGMGWDLGQTRTAIGVRRYVAHSGSKKGAATYLLMYPERGVVVTVMSNQRIPDLAAFWPRTLAFDIADEVFGDTTQLAIAATSANKNEGNSGGIDFTFTVTRSGILSGITTVNYAVTGIGGLGGFGLRAASANDFVGNALPNGVVTFATGETSRVITIRVRGDAAVEADEAFRVTLSNASLGASIRVSIANGLIRNDD